MRVKVRKRLVLLGLLFVLGFTACSKEQWVNNKESEINLQGTDSQQNGEEESGTPRQENEKPTTQTEPEKELKMDASVYDEQLQLLYNLLSNPNEIAIFDMEGMTGLGQAFAYLKTNELLNKTGYAIKDINGDKIPELIIADINDFKNDKSYGSSLYTLYTYADGKVVCLLDGYARNQFGLLANGQLYNVGSSGAIYYNSTIYELPENGTSIKCIECYFTHERNGDYEDIAIYHDTTGVGDVEDAEETNLTLDEFWSKEEELNSKVVSIELIPFSTYENARPLDMVDFANAKINEDTFCAVAYLGYLDGEYQQLTEYLYKTGYLKKYPFMAKVEETHVILEEGSEWYFILPIEDGMDLKVSQGVLNESDYTIQEGVTLYSSVDNMPIIVRGNISEIMPNLLVSAARKDGEICVFSPTLSMMDGTLQNVKGILDITDYEFVENIAFEIITDPKAPEYIFSNYRAYTIATPNVTEEEPEPVLLTGLKEDMKVFVELIGWKEDGSDYLIERIEELEISKGESLFISSMLQEVEPGVRVTAIYTENGIEKKAVWYSYAGEDGAYYKEYVSGY